MIDEMTLHEFEELCTYWTDHPPVHLMVAAYLGIEPKGRREPARSTAAQPEASFPLELLSMPGLGAPRAFSEEFGPEAIGEIRALWQRYEAAKAVE